jgi:hypothetical protein
MKPAPLRLDPFTEGDEWDGVPSISITVGPQAGPFAPPTTPLSVVTMRFRKQGVSTNEVVELSSVTPAQITILNAATWTFRIPPQVVPALTHGKWIFRIKCRDSSGTGRPKTYLGDEITVLETV